MSGIITPSGLVNELTVIADDDTISEVNVPGEAFNRQVKKSVDKTYMQKDIKDGTEQLNPRSFTSGRFDSQELESGALSAGWITVAEISDVGNRGGTADFSFGWTGGRSTYRIKAQFGNSSGVKTHENTDIEIIGSNDDAGIFLGARIAKSDSVIDAGAKLQIKISGSIAFNILMNNNTGRVIGWTLVTPFLDNTPTLPDGSTVGTFLEAGAELSLPVGNQPSIQCLKANDDQMSVIIQWPEIPKQGTGLTIETLTNVRITEQGAQVTLTGGATISNFEIFGKLVKFVINDTGLFVSLGINVPLFVRIVGATNKFTIT